MCLKTQGLFEARKYYYCFADEGDHFWIHAPFLLKELGVDQIKVPSASRENFITENQYYESKQKTLKILSG